MLSSPRRVAAVASAVSLLAVGAPVAGAAAAASTSTVSPTFTSTVPLPAFQLPSWSTLTFVPPALGPIEVHIGAIIISNKVISPGVNIVMPPITMPPFVLHPGG
jgi:hypothetical protein